ncbi:MAG: thiolase family protein [Thaumarchaeota archaeon]|nr:thiolase family protein [Candidatus Calditenuaceae archaeon]MDW8041983.1 thiolase family protein [Nitrososphaerota archaeon]
MRSVHVVGVGYTRVGEHWGDSLTELMAEASLAAIEDAGVERVDGIYVASTFCEVTNNQAGISALVAEALGLRSVYGVRVEGGESSGLMALMEAYAAVASGLVDFALVVGGEKLSDLLPDEFNSVHSMTLPYDSMGYAGVTPASIAALLYKTYLERYEVPQEFVAQFPVLMHNNAEGVSHAQFPFKVKLEDVLGSPEVAPPLRRLECSAPCDGAAAVVLASDDSQTRRLSGQAVRIGGISIRTDYVSPFDREDPLFMTSVALSVDEALLRSGISRSELNVLEVHDSFSILAPLILESGGFSSRSESGPDVKSGKYSLGGELPINTFGGLKARGHPIGATALYQVAEVYLQLTGRAGKKQVDRTKAGAIISVSGFGTIAGTAVMLSGEMG